MISAVEVVVNQVKDLDCKSRTEDIKVVTSKLEDQAAMAFVSKREKVFVSSVYPDFRHWLKHMRRRFGPRLCICATQRVQIGALLLIASSWSHLPFHATHGGKTSRNYRIDASDAPSQSNMIVETSTCPAQPPDTGPSWSSVASD
jgi:hypothetical protein